MDVFWQFNVFYFKKNTLEWGEVIRWENYVQKPSTFRCPNCARNVSLAFAAEYARKLGVTSEPLTKIDMRAQVILSSALLDFSILKCSTLTAQINWALLTTNKYEPCLRFWWRLNKGAEYCTFIATFVTPWLYLLYNLVSIYIIFAQTGL